MALNMGHFITQRNASSPREKAKKDILQQQYTHLCGFCGMKEIGTFAGQMIKYRSYLGYCTEFLGQNLVMNIKIIGLIFFVNLLVLRRSHFVTHLFVLNLTSFNLEKERKKKNSTSIFFG